MLTISAPQFDIDGQEVIDSPDPAGLFEFVRRVSRSATLDGGAAINDFGYSDADRTLTIDWKPDSQAVLDNLSRMVKAYSRLIVSFSEGCFIGAPESLTSVDDTARLVILVERRLDQ